MNNNTSVSCSTTCCRTVKRYIELLPSHCILFHKQILPFNGMKSSLLESCNLDGTSIMTLLKYNYPDWVSDFLRNQAVPPCSFEPGTTVGNSMNGLYIQKEYY